MNSRSTAFPEFVFHLLLVLFTCAITLSCNESVDNENASDDPNPPSLINIPDISISCSEATNCINSSNGDLAFVKYLFNGSEYASGYAVTTCNSGICSATVNEWNLNGNTITRFAKRDYLIHAFIDINNDSESDPGEPESGDYFPTNSITLNMNRSTIPLTIWADRQIGPDEVNIPSISARSIKAFGVN